MKKYICYNGKYLPADENIFNVRNRSFRYGDGLFESIFATKMRIPLLDKHYRRLTEGMEILKLDIPSHFTKDYVNNLILRLLNRNKQYKGARVRLQVFRNGNGMYIPDDNTFSFVIETEVMVNDKFQINKKKISIDIYDGFLKQTDLLSKYKTANALPFIKAALWVKKNYLDDCLLLSASKGVCEALSSNVFVVVEKYLTTPNLESGCVDGVMRKQLITVAKRNGYQINEVKKLEEGLLLRADEILLTNAVHGIQWVMGFRDRRYFFKHAEILTRLLNDSLGL